MQEKKPKKVLKRGHNIKQKKRDKKSAKKKFTYQSQEIHRNIFPKNSAKKGAKISIGVLKVLKKVQKKVQ